MSNSNSVEQKGAIRWDEKSRSESSTSSNANVCTTQSPSRRDETLVTKPVIWTRIKALWNILFRAFGLSLISHAFGSLRHPVGRGLHEPTKIAMNQNRFVALLRALIHIVPRSVTGSETSILARTDSRSIPESCSVATTEEITGVCPSAQWPKIRDYLYLERYMLPSAYKAQFYVSQAPNKIELADRSSVRYLTITEDESYLGLGPRPVTAMTQHAVVADALTNTGALWFLSLTNVTARKGHGHPLSDQSDALHTISDSYLQPYSTVVCIPDSISNVNSSRPLALPRLPNANPASLTNGNFSYDGCEPGTEEIAETIAHPTITREQIYNIPHSTRDYRLEWLELDSEHFQGSSIGAVVFLPRAQKNATQDVILCNLSAGWGTSTLSMSTVGGGDTAVSSKVTHKDNHSTRAQPMKLTNIPAYETTEAANTGDYFDYHLPNYPRQLINITREWAKYLNPTIAGLNTSVMNTLLQQQLFSCTPRVTVEQALVSLVVNGLAKTGAGSQLQGKVRTVGPEGDQGLDGNYWLSGKGNVFQVDHPNEDWLKFHVTSTLEGYGYNAFEVSQRLAIAFLIIYCILALGHMVYAIGT
ncbi:MAG: hypothetical protein Q9191_004490, partial [Dirinaria sp. TL-2023a]